MGEVNKTASDGENNAMGISPTKIAAKCEIVGNMCAPTSFDFDFAQLHGQNPHVTRKP